MLKREYAQKIFQESLIFVFLSVLSISFCVFAMFKSNALGSEFVYFGSKNKALKSGGHSRIQIVCKL